MSKSVSQQIPTSQSSDPALVMMTSNPSIAAVNAVNAGSGTRNILKIISVILAIFAVAAILLSLFIYKSQKSEMLKAKELAEKNATEIKHITPQSYTPEAVAQKESEDRAKGDGLVFFSLFTTPPGAEVYANNMFIGTTPIEQLRMKKSDDSLKILISLPGYHIVRKVVPLSDNFSDALTLNEIVVANTAVKSDPNLAPDDIPLTTDGISANKGFDVTQHINENKDKGKGKGKGKGDNNSKPTDVVVLPD